LQIHEKGFKRFTIVDTNGVNLDLGVTPRPGVEVLQVVEVDDNGSSLWHCECSVMMK